VNETSGSYWIKGLTKAKGINLNNCKPFSSVKFYFLKRANKLGCGVAATDGMLLGRALMMDVNMGPIELSSGLITIVLALQGASNRLEATNLCIYTQT